MAKSSNPQPATVGFFSLATAAALVTVFTWGGTPIITKFGVVSVDVMSLALLRTVMSLPLAVLIIVVLRCALPWRGNDKWLLVLVGIPGVVGFPVLFTLGIGLTSAGHAAVVTAATPVFVGFLEAVVSRKLPPRRWWIGVSVAFVGAVILIAEAVGLDSADATWQGDLLAAAGGFSAAVSFVAGARLTPRYGAVGVTMWGVVIAGVVQVPFVIMRMDAEAWAAVEPLGWTAIIYLSLGSTIVAYISWIFALSRGGIGRMSVWQFAMPIVGVAGAAIFLGEPLTGLLVAATVIILFGVGLVQRR
ncbi:MAG: DMT family transporter [Rhodospirillaceae bacterium]|jgi:drug/metabolite transporter (DMT)-like permease|nr:DMT family transporter [Rhodospirillaceae bacterium]MBT5943605.1 DMT family transporter [Rhodospirillaceae bacterium]MBT6405942.1 DMT family transporter [Rhodospirillaceae bacterium]MBT6535880.1 DMT family transporter [Rhodospirillaceae bacterium]MBT7362732.1 DMT family transporter [Rhodospirillaceae bacterium]